MKNLIWNVIVEWDAVWQQSAKSLLKTIELSLSWPDLCQLVAGDKQTCPAGDHSSRDDILPESFDLGWTIRNDILLSSLNLSPQLLQVLGPLCSVLTSDSPQLFTLSAVSYLLYYFTGAKKLVEKIKEYNPKIAVFNGKGIYEVFSGEKEFIFGKQPQKIADTDTVQ